MYCVEYLHKLYVHCFLLLIRIISHLSRHESILNLFLCFLSVSLLIIYFNVKQI